MSTVICMASVKGGSGKTSLTASFGAMLAAVGKRVVLVDTDATTNGLTLLYLDHVLRQREEALGEPRKNKPRGLFEITPDEVVEQNVVRRSGSLPVQLVEVPTGASLVPATYQFLNTEDVPLDQYERALAGLISILRRDFDFIFLDSQAGSDAFAHASMRRGVSDAVVIVSEYDPLSAAGVERLKALFPEDLSYVRTWVLLNKMLPEFVASFSEFLEVARYLRPIPWEADVVRAYTRREIALDVQRGNAYTTAIVGTLRGLLARDDVEDLDLWVSSRASAIREPLERQIEDVQKELAALTRLESGRAAEYRVLAVAAGVAATLLAAGVTAVVTHHAAAWFAVAFVSASTLLTGFIVFVDRRLRRREPLNDPYVDVLKQRLLELTVLMDSDTDVLALGELPEQARRNAEVWSHRRRSPPDEVEDQ